MREVFVGLDRAEDHHEIVSVEHKITAAKGIAGSELVLVEEGHHLLSPQLTRRPG